MLDSVSDISNKKNLFKDFSCDNVVSKKNFLMSAYSNNEIQYYNDPNTKKKKNIRKIAIISTLIITACAVLATIFRGRFKDISKLVKAENFDAVTDSIKKSGFINKTGSFLSNINTIKDDLFEKMADNLNDKNVPILKYIKNYCNGTKKLYTNIVRKFQKSVYEKYAAVLEKEGIEVLSYDKWFEQTNNLIFDTLKKDKHVTDGIFNSKDKIFANMTNGNLADNVLGKNKDFVEFIESSNIENLTADAKVAYEGLNKTKGTIIGKLRDINVGSAATDFLTMIISAIGLSVAVLISDTKEERKSVAINLGIPLFTALSCNSFIGNAKGINGAASLLFSLAAGRIASVVAKFASDKFDSKVKQLQNQA